MTIYRDELEAILAETATENKTVIIAVVNKAYVEGDKSMLDLFLDGFWLGDDTRGLRDHLLIVAVDQTAYERCMFLKLHCYKLETDGVDYDGEKLFMSADFVKMMWRRTLFLGDVLKRGYNFIFTDTDVMWLRNPFPRLNPNETIDLQISTDVFYGNEWSESNKINTGFYMIRSNNKTIALFDNWYAKKDKSTGMKEQDVLEMLMHEGVFKGLGLRVRFLDTLFFSGFCQTSSDVSAVVTVHANCCRSISAKLTDLMDVIHHWKTFKNFSTNETLTIEWSKHLAYCTNIVEETICTARLICEMLNDMVTVMKQMDSNEGGWRLVFRRRQGRKGPLAKLHTIFVDEISESMYPKGLFTTFSNFGVVKDVYLPKKRRKATRTRFGFVRYDCSVAAGIAIQKANGVWCGDRTLKVKKADFGRDKEPTYSRAVVQKPVGILTSAGTSVGGRSSYAESLSMHATMRLNLFKATSINPK
ncbi:hypothetical protein ACSBR2_007955 [Camellia fascicularis]